MSSLYKQGTAEIGVQFGEHFRESVVGVSYDSCLTCPWSSAGEVAQFSKKIISTLVLFNIAVAMKSSGVLCFSTRSSDASAGRC